MKQTDSAQDILVSEKIGVIETAQPHEDELYLTVENDDFARAALVLHKRLDSGVMMFFAQDLRAESGKFKLYCVFLDARRRSWVVLCRDVEAGAPVFTSLAKEIYSAAFFEREMKEMFGIMPQGNPDVRRLRLHDEIWPEGYYPLRKDFTPPQEGSAGQGQYRFHRVEGEGVFEVPVGPVHAGIIGPGHFRFSVAGEPIISLEIRHGWTHRGIEKLLEGKTFLEAADLCERISGDTAFGYGWAFCQSVEKISGCKAPARAQLIRVIYLELERVYNHINDMGGIALDVGFSFPAQFAAMIKERLLRLNGDLCGSRYLKGVNTPGGIRSDIDAQKQGLIRSELTGVEKDFLELQKMLFSSVSFMDRVDSTGTLRTKTARDLNITGVAARASGIALDMRKDLPGIYRDLSFTAAKEQAGDVAARLKVRCNEVVGSLGLIRQCLDKLSSSDTPLQSAVQEKEGFALGCVEAWRGPLRVWTRLDARGRLVRCKIVDPSFQNWEGLAFAVLGNIIPDFPLCNKSFDLSYPGNDL